MTGYMYILECADGTYYTGSTKNLEKRLWQHQNFLGANFTKKKYLVKLVYFEEYSRIDEAFYREKQIQGWSHAKKKALIERRTKDLPILSRNYTQYGKPPVPSTSSVTDISSDVSPDISSDASSVTGVNSGTSLMTDSKKGR